MPQIKKPKVAKAKKKKLVSPALVQAKSSKAQVKRKNPVAYYQCMCHQAQKGIKPKKITQVAQECKHNALTINAKMSAAKTKAAKKIQTGYATMGQGLAELIAASK
jgi:hypothetical protein